MDGRAVLVGVDGSPASRDAVVLGERLAGGEGGSLHLVTAVTDPLVDVVVTRLRLDVEAMHTELADRAREAALQAVEDLLPPGGARRLLTVRLGRAEHVLAEVAREVAADLVVLGGHRRPPPRSWIRRGTARHLLRATDRSVLVTGPSGPEVERVVAAVDLSPAGPAVARAAHDLAARLGASLELVHVVHLPELPVAWSSHVDPKALAGEQQASATVELVELLPGTPRRILQGEPVPTLTRVAKEGPSTLLVVGAQGRGRVERLLLGSVTEALLASLPCAILVAPTRAELF